MTGRVNLTPEAERQLNEIDDWITKQASADIAQRFISTLLEHIDGIPIFPNSGLNRDDVRPGLRTTSFRKRTLIAYKVDHSADTVAITVLGVFHGGQDWETALETDQDGSRETT